jgi:hypothetical protein
MDYTDFHGLFSYMSEDKLLYRELTGTSLEEALILNYLKVTKLRVGLAINLGELSLTHIRRVL